MKKVIILIIAVAVMAGCREDVTEKTKEAIEKSSEVVERTANKVVDEVSAHIERDMGCKLVLSEELKAKGITTGKFYIENDSVTKKDNKLVIYLITEKAFSGDITFKVAGDDGTELGRATLQLNTKAGSAGYHDIAFDKRTDIENKSIINIY
ncbi:hypothetical protein CHU92_02915 [Flavobacterium cyanobacteriorum]|uniref:Lipoprotein n=1 Tax=Flavobacterium cyanobacteriorum TaxID=2022802 RepID=A0A255ZSG5_9FLAO|nr:hypothetical protein [Flavobacterium cyanobacteriorum]OYQ43815.1 hypothetical protein CHU92_02915 [Flavobacterium cyanobacteriorum]